VATSWRPIGEILVDRGEISRERLDAALAEQRQSGRRLGEILVLAGDISWLALAQAIAEQADALDDIAPTAAEPAPAAPTVFPDSGTAEDRLQAVEDLLKDRQRAFLELVATADSLRRRVAQLEEKLAQREAELIRVKSAAPQSE
jgi:polyhydroxyalkanoate synthesis regulator phasin